MWALRQYENQHGANESTYWIFFELLWREYFFWYARAHGRSLFTLNGLRHQVAYSIRQDAQRLAERSNRIPARQRMHASVGSHWVYVKPRAPISG